MYVGLGLEGLQMSVAGNVLELPTNTCVFAYTYVSYHYLKFC